MDYGLDVWYSASTAAILEIFQKEFFKRNFGVRINTPDHAVFAKLGILPVSLRLKNNVLKHLHRLNASATALRSNGHIKNLSHCTFEYRFQNLVWKSLPTKARIWIHIRWWEFSWFARQPCKEKTRQCISHNFLKYLAKWNQRWCHMQKTQNIQTLQVCFQVWKVRAHWNVRVAISRYRMSSHHLPIDRGFRGRPELSTFSAYEILSHNFLTPSLPPLTR